MGGGCGFTFYSGNQRGSSLPFVEKGYSEFRPSYFLELNKELSSAKEFGVKFMHAQFLTAKHSDISIYAMRGEFEELSFNFHKSINDNVDLASGCFTYNVIYGLGVINFRSMMFTIPTKENPTQNMLSSVGYSPGYGDAYIINRLYAGTANLGFEIGARLNSHVLVYFENVFTLCSTTKLSGNLYRISYLPPDAYFFSGIGIYYRMPSQRLGCHKGPRRFALFQHQ